MEKKDFSLISLGEIMLRLSPIGNQRLNEGGHFSKCAGCSELNVAAGVAGLGLKSAIISKLPRNLLGNFVRHSIRTAAVSDRFVLEDKDINARLGLYYFEGGRHPRKPQVIYDRANSSFTRYSTADINPAIFSQADCFHVSGISMALGPKPREAAIALIKCFKESGALISFDVNYRAALWSEAEARELILSLLPYIDILFISEESCRLMLQRSGSLKTIQKELAAEFALSYVASSRREVVSPRCHHFGSLIYERRSDQWFDESDYRNIEVLDRIGSGDAYVAGVLYALLSGKTAARAVSYGNAMAAVKCTVEGDLTNTSADEIEGIIRSHHAKKLGCEMNR